MRPSWTEYIIRSCSTPPSLEIGWQHEYFSSFRHLGTISFPVSAHDFGMFLETMRKANGDLVAMRAVPIMDLVYAGFLLSVLESLSLNYEGNIEPIYELVSVLQAIPERLRELDDIRSATGDISVVNEYRFQLANLYILPCLFFGRLVQREMMDEVRKLVATLYTAYEERLAILLDSSSDWDTWMFNIANLLPDLIIRCFVPIHDRVYFRGSSVVVSDKLCIDEPRGFCDPGYLHRTSRFFETAFSETEISDLARHEIRMQETFANLIAIPMKVSGDMYDPLDADIEYNIMRISKNKGGVEAKKAAIYYWKVKLQIPTYRYVELARQIDASRA